MYLKYITNFNLKATPLFSFCNYSEWNFNINEKLSNIVDNDNLIVYCVQETYGYRVGMFGLLSHLISDCIPFQTFYLKEFLNSNIRYYQSNNMLSSDGEIISSFIGKFNRYIPIFNIGTWDYKNSLLTKNFFYENNSIPNMFDFTSPMLDSGCGIFSNQKPYATGYEPLDFVNKRTSISDNLSSKGIVWSFFMNNDKKGITIISFNLSDDLFELTKLLELEQIISLKNKLHNRFGLMVNEYETYIIGDFKIKFTDDSESFLQLTKDLTFNYEKTQYLLYQRESPNENCFDEIKNDYSNEIKDEFKIKIKDDEIKEDEIKEDEIKGDVKIKINDEIKEHDVKINDEIKEGTFINVFNPLNNYFSNPSTSPSSTSNSSNEWVLI
jgi:hypothetical protein